MYEHSDYLREQAAKYLELAKKIANDMDDRRVSG